MIQSFKRYLKVISFLFAIFITLPILAPHQLLANSLPLSISGNQIVTSEGCTLRLRGVDVSGLEYSPYGDTGTGAPTTNINGTTMTDYVAIAAEAVTAWHCNIIRLPFNQDFWFGCSNSKGTPDQTAYQSEIQAVVNYCSQNNAYVDLDLHWSGNYIGTSPTTPCSGGGWGSVTAQQMMPDWNSVTLWASVASQFANNPAVLFDLFNEPYFVTWDVWRNGGTTSWSFVYQGVTYSGTFNTPGLQTLLTTIRNTGANNVVVAGGLNWAYDLTGIANGSTSCNGSNCALTDTTSGNGVLYSAHVYSSKGSTTGWDTYVTSASSSNAVIIEEFGASVTDAAGWDNTAISWFNGSNANNYVYSAMAWAFSPDVSPSLITSFNGYPTTSYHGVPVSTWLANISSTGTCPTWTPTPCGYPGPTCTLTFTPTPTATPLPGIGPAKALPTIIKGALSCCAFKVPELNATLKARVYTLTGELVASINGTPGTSQCVWCPKGSASGLYLSVVDETQSNGNFSREKLRVLVIH